MFASDSRFAWPQRSVFIDESLFVARGFPHQRGNLAGGGQRYRRRTHGIDTTGGVRLDARQFPTGEGERSSRPLSMGPERATRRAMVDRRRGWEIHHGKRKNRQSKRDLRGEGQGLGGSIQPSDGRHVGLPYRPVKNSRRSGGGEKPRRNFPLKFRFDPDSDVGSRIGFL